jgi:hypothetical protein
MQRSSWIRLYRCNRPVRHPAIGKVVLSLLMLSLIGGCGGRAPSTEPAVVDPEYSFFVAGHAYGEPGVDNPGVHPPFKAAFAAIQEQGAALGVLTGDIVWSATVADWDGVDQDLQSLGIPVYFAVGNHDMNDRALFVSRYGPTYYRFKHDEDLFVVLDSELDPCNIVGDQMAFLTNTLQQSDARYVFVFVHRLIWVVEGTPYLMLQDKMNTADGYDFHDNFWSEVVPVLRAPGVPVYVFAGDIGVTWAQSLFYERDGNVHLVASGMGGSEEENYLMVKVGAEGVEVVAERLDGRPLKRRDITAYDLRYYRGL